jgi:hypothetical protein
MDLRAQIDPNIVIMGDLNTLLSPIDQADQVIQAKDLQRNFRAPSHIRSNRHDRYLQSISPNNKAIHIILCISWNFLQNRLYLGHKASVNKFKKIETTPFIISDPNRIKPPDLNNKRNHRKYSNKWRLKNTLLKGPVVTK